MRYRIVHKTFYRYAAPVTLCHNEAHLMPRSIPGQTCLSSALKVIPTPRVLSTHEDFFGNGVYYFSVQQNHDELTVTATSEVQREPEHQLHFTAQANWNEVVMRLGRDPAPRIREARQYLLDSPMVRPWDELADYARRSFPEGRALAEAVHDLMERIHHEFAYQPGYTKVATPLTEVFEHRRGVCQDFAHLAIACLRSQGLAARYVSGYLETLPPPGQQKLAGGDASHAWFSVFDPDVGWLDFDPTNNQVPMDQHITTAWGRDYSDITPLKGVVYGGGPGHQTLVSVDVARLDG